MKASQVKDAIGKDVTINSDRDLGMCVKFRKIFGKKCKLIKQCKSGKLLVEFEGQLYSVAMYNVDLYEEPVKHKHRMTQGQFNDYEAASHGDPTVRAHWEKLKLDPGIEIIPESERDSFGIGDRSVMFMYPNESKFYDLPMLIPAGKSKDTFVVDCSPNLWEYIGALSEDLFHCSYNENWVRLVWAEGRLDKEVAEKLQQYPWLFEHHKREDGRYQDQMTALVKQAGGWTKSWGAEPLLPLTEVEQAMVDAFTCEIFNHQADQIQIQQPDFGDSDE